MFGVTLCVTNNDVIYIVLYKIFVLVGGDECFTNK